MDGRSALPAVVNFGQNRIYVDANRVIIRHIVCRKINISIVRIGETDARGVGVQGCGIELSKALAVQLPPVDSRALVLILGIFPVDDKGGEGFHGELGGDGFHRLRVIHGNRDQALGLVRRVGHQLRTLGGNVRHLDGGRVDPLGIDSGQGRLVEMHLHGDAGAGRRLDHRTGGDAAEGEIKGKHAVVLFAFGRQGSFRILKALRAFQQRKDDQLHRLREGALGRRHRDGDLGHHLGERLGEGFGFGLVFGFGLRLGALQRLAGVHSPKQSVKNIGGELIVDGRNDLFILVLDLGDDLLRFDLLDLAILVQHDEGERIILRQPIAADGERHIVLDHPREFLYGFFVRNDQTHAPEESDLVAQLLLHHGLQGLELIGVKRTELQIGMLLGFKLAVHDHGQRFAVVPELEGQHIGGILSGDLFGRDQSADGAGVLPLAGFLEGGFLGDLPLAPVMAEGGDGFLLGNAADGAGVLPLAVLITGRLTEHGPLAPLVAEGGDGFLLGNAADRAGVLPLAVLITGRLAEHGPLAPGMTKGRDRFGLSQVAGRAGMLPLAVLSAGGLRRDGPLAPGMPAGDGLGLDLAAFGADTLPLTVLGAGGFFRKGPLTPGMLMNGPLDGRFNDGFFDGFFLDERVGVPRFRRKRGRGKQADRQQHSQQQRSKPFAFFPHDQIPPCKTVRLLCKRSSQENRFLLCGFDSKA